MKNNRLTARPSSGPLSSWTHSVRASGSFQRGSPPSSPNHFKSGTPSSSRSVPSANCRRCRTGNRRTKAMAFLKKSTMSWLRETASQSNQLIALSWQYALLLPCCVRANSSPPRIIGVPDANSSRHTRFFICWRRSARTHGSSLGPSTPQFHELLSLLPSLLFSWFCSLCFWLYETRSFSVNPSWHVTKFTLLYAERPSSPYISADPVSRQPKSDSWPASLLAKRLTVSRKRPFHSDQSTGKLPT